MIEHAFSVLVNVAANYAGWRAAVTGQTPKLPRTSWCH